MRRVTVVCYQYHLELFSHLSSSGCVRLGVFAVADVQIVDVRRIGYYRGGFASAAIEKETCVRYVGKFMSCSHFLPHPPFRLFLAHLCYSLVNIRYNTRVATCKSSWDAILMCSFNCGITSQTFARNSLKIYQRRSGLLKPTRRLMNSTVLGDGVDQDITVRYTNYFHLSSFD